MKTIYLSSTVVGVMLDLNDFFFIYTEITSVAMGTKIYIIYALKVMYLTLTKKLI